MRIIVPLLLAAFLGTAANAAKPATPPITNVLLTSDYDVQADGTYTRTLHFERRASSDAAAQRIAQFAFTYHPPLGGVEVLEAYTKKADGQMLKVEPAGIRDQPSASDPTLMTFTDGRQKVILFPQVSAGDTVVFTLREKVTRLRFAGMFSTVHFFTRSEAWDDVQISVKAPSSLPLQIEAVGAEVTQENDRDSSTYRWRFSAPAAKVEDVAAVAPIDRLPRLVVTSAPDWDAVGRAYATLAEPKSAVTPRVQALADELTAGVTDRRQQAERLYNWVAEHIRYIAVFFGNGAVVPHAADTVLANGYGDCKDHAMLLNALLKAKGIASENVLINLGNSYRLTVPAPFAQLNHVINYLPEFQLYADSTSMLAAFGTLPFGEYGKPVIHAASSDVGLRQIPVLAHDDASTTLTTVAHFTEDGRIEGESTTEASGAFTMSLRGAIRRIEGMGMEAGPSRILHDLGEEGTGEVEPPAADLSAPRITAKGTFDVDGAIHLAGGNILWPPSGFRLLVRPGDLLLGRLDLRGLPDTEPTPCYSGHQVEVLTFTLPAERHVQRLPTGRTIATEAFRFTSRWSTDGQSVTVRREVDSHIDQPLCSGPLRVEAARALAEIRRDYADRVILDDQ